MKTLIFTVFILLGLINSEVLSYIVLTPLFIYGAALFLGAAAKGGAFK